MQKGNLILYYGVTHFNPAFAPSVFPFVYVQPQKTSNSECGLHESSVLCDERSQTHVCWGS